MEREILFRGKCVENGKWIEGYYNLLEIGSNPVPIIIPFQKLVKARMSDVFMYQVIPSTVGKYTGLTDKNGRKIFEGDLIIESNATGKDKIPREVIWRDLSYMCPYIKHHWAYGDNCVSLDFLYRLKNGEIEVIGNIHDNLELLGGE